MKEKKRAALAASILVAAVMAAGILMVGLPQATLLPYQRGPVWSGLVTRLQGWLHPPRTTYLSYSDADPWAQYITRELTLEDGVACVTTTVEPGPLSWDWETTPTTRSRRTMSPAERRLLDWVVFRGARVQDWPEHTGYDPKDITDQVSWYLTVTCEDGVSYEKRGYGEYPEGLGKISQVLQGTYTNGEEGNS